MTERHKSLKETKVLLSSVLIAHKTGILINRLEHEYRTFIGKPIPFMKLGFHTLEDFLREIPDTVLIEEDEKGNKLVKVKVIKNIAHVDKLVQNQKEHNPSSRKQKPNYGGKARYSTTHWNYHGSKMPPFETQQKIILLVKEKQVFFSIHELLECFLDRFSSCLTIRSTSFQCCLREIRLFEKF